MEKDNLSKIGTKLIAQTIAIILFIAVCTFFIMKLIDKESDSLSIFFIGFGAAFVSIVLLAIYIRYVVNIYNQIRNTKINRPMVLNMVQNEKNHLKAAQHKNHIDKKRKGKKKQGKR